MRGSAGLEEVTALISRRPVYRCSLGMTGLIVSVKLRVEPAFRLRELKEPMSFDELVADAPAYKDDPAAADAGDKKEDDDEYTGGRVDEIARSAEHVRMWWYPQTRGVVVARANRTQDVSRAGRTWGSMA